MGRFGCSRTIFLPLPCPWSTSSSSTKLCHHRWGQRFWPTRLNMWIQEDLTPTRATPSWMLSLPIGTRTIGRPFRSCTASSCIELWTAMELCPCFWYPSQPSCGSWHLSYSNHLQKQSTSRFVNWSALLPNHQVFMIESLQESPVLCMKQHLNKSWSRPTDPWRFRCFRAFWFVCSTFSWRPPTFLTKPGHRYVECSSSSSSDRWSAFPESSQPEWLWLQFLAFHCLLAKHESFFSSQNDASLYVFRFSWFFMISAQKCNQVSGLWSSSQHSLSCLGLHLSCSQDGMKSLFHVLPLCLVVVARSNRGEPWLWLLAGRDDDPHPVLDDREISHLVFLQIGLAEREPSWIWASGPLHLRLALHLRMALLWCNLALDT